jgi:hypothetical protein
MIGEEWNWKGLSGLITNGLQEKSWKIIMRYDAINERNTIFNQ